jgi:hypothetical protein
MNELTRRWVVTGKDGGEWCGACTTRRTRREKEIGMPSVARASRNWISLFAISPLSVWVDGWQDSR